VSSSDAQPELNPLQQLLRAIDRATLGDEPPEPSSAPDAPEQLPPEQSPPGQSAPEQSAPEDEVARLVCMGSRSHYAQVFEEPVEPEPLWLSGGGQVVTLFQHSQAMHQCARAAQRAGIAAAEASDIGNAVMARLKFHAGRVPCSTAAQLFQFALRATQWHLTTPREAWLVEEFIAAEMTPAEMEFCVQAPAPDNNEQPPPAIAGSVAQHGDAPFAGEGSAVEAASTSPRKYFSTLKKILTSQVMSDAARQAEAARRAEAERQAEEARQINATRKTIQNLNLQGALHTKFKFYERAAPPWRRITRLVLQVMEEGYEPLVRVCGSLLPSTPHQFESAYDAEMFYGAARVAIRRLVGDDDPVFAACLTSYADYLWNSGERDKAVEHYRQAIAITQRASGDLHPELATRCVSLAELLAQADRETEAIAFCGFALQIVDHLPEMNVPEMNAEVSGEFALCLTRIARVYRHLAVRGVESLYLRAQSITRNAPGRHHASFVAANFELAWFYCATERYEEAAPLFQQALETTRRVRGEEHPEVATALLHQARYYLRIGRGSEAASLSLFNKATHIMWQAMEDRHPDFVAGLLSGVWHEWLGYQREHGDNDVPAFYNHAIDILQRELQDEES